MNKRLSSAALAITGLLAVGSAQAAISGNFCSVAPIVDFGPGVGVVPLLNWNDLTEPAGYSAGGSVAGPMLISHTGASLAPSVSLAWDVPNGGAQNTNDNITRPVAPSSLGNDIQDGHDQMMTGYLQASRKAPTFLTPYITFSGSGMTQAFTGSYSVILYIDGDSDVQSGAVTPNANNQYAVSIWTDATKTVSLGTTVYGRDVTDFTSSHTVADSLADYTRVTSTINGSPTVGNYVQLDGLTSDSFYIEIVGVAAGTNGLSNNGGHGVALNGFQIVPEPASLSLMALGGLLLLRRRQA